jgi:CubicO group peptidase (beta-lactamase class C family)
VPSHGVGDGESRLYYEMPITRDELLARLADVRQAVPFRTAWRYSNLMYVVAGRMAGEATGSSWDDFMRQRLFEPLEMHRTYTSRASLATIENVAVPHVRVDNKTFTTNFADQDNIGPAASICSSASDLSQWLLLITGRGEFHGRHSSSRRPPSRK